MCQSFWNKGSKHLKHIQWKTCQGQTSSSEQDENFRWFFGIGHEFKGC